jgi:DNA-binding response OmpR family regulator
MSVTVLIVDDEKDLVELIRYHLEKNGLTCLEARDGESALLLAKDRSPDLMVLDLMLPGIDGLEVCRILRKDPKTASLAIIMLTAKAEEVDRIVGLEMGADDYMVKPFSPRELVARVKAVLRRGQGQETLMRKRVGLLEVDEGTHQVYVPGAVVELTVKEFDLLCALMKANGRVLHRDRIMETVWGYSNAVDIESRTVDVHVRRLREKLGEEHKRVVTVKGVGYRFDSKMT